MHRGQARVVVFPIAVGGSAVTGRVDRLVRSGVAACRAAVSAAVLRTTARTAAKVRNMICIVVSNLCAYGCRSGLADWGSSRSIYQQIDGPWLALMLPACLAQDLGKY
jgi:hypothetical protein